MRLSPFARAANALSRARPKPSSSNRATTIHPIPTNPISTNLITTNPITTNPISQRTSTAVISQRTSTAVATPAVSSMWPIGTWDDPLPIVSTAHQRVVACTGPSAHSGAVAQHDTVWITVEKDKLCQCPSCRQVFKLQLRQS